MSHHALSSNTSRKRSRNDYVTSVQSTISTQSWSTSFSPSTVSPAPLANSRYRLSGGLDTPTATEQAAYEKYENPPGSGYELDFRRGRPFHEPQSLSFGDSDELPAPLAHESNGRPRAQAFNTPNHGWSKAVFNTLTGAAGKVWDFCRAGVPFRGFFAGGGQGYAMDTPRFQREDNQSPSNSIWEDYEGSATPIPGEYPRIPYIEDYMDSPAVYDTSERALKKTKHCREDEGNLTRSWVVVNESPSRRKFPPSSASPASMRKPGGRTTFRRQSQVPSPVTVGRPASAAGLRSPNGHRRTNSREQTFTPKPKAARQSIPAQHESPIARETAKHLKEIRRRERQEDREINEINKRLQDMIREGKEALGSKVEVELDVSDEDP